MGEEEEGRGGKEEGRKRVNASFSIRVAHSNSQVKRALNERQYLTSYSLVDIYPTLMELCWLKTSENSPKFDGVSLVPFFSSDSGLRLASHQEHIALTFAITPNNTALRLVVLNACTSHPIRTNRWRYIRYSEFSEELYDMEADPHEWENKAADPAYSHIKEGFV